MDDFGFRKWARIDPGDGRNRFFEVGDRSGVSKKFFLYFYFSDPKSQKSGQKSSRRGYNGHFGHFWPKIAKNGQNGHYSLS